ncbi:glycosyl transferase [Parapedobacter pyrenivorans]|uniref:Glycosyl transferase n=1 Tax=Parapedobacter pyrenivorans TaxID=1305674 RepID=A0A917MA88_9SPHI|nr:glycosyltransferase [Parapedobacter pyrenivorans]GGG84857.1 glycosyl transferase [Parapedobacter pyrenivorans]
MTEEKNIIPKIIHYCWLSDDPYPDLIQKCLDSWKEKLVDYELCRWDIETSPKVPWISEAYESKKYAFAADYVRFYALYHVGGIYLDADVEVFKSFDSLLVNRSFIGYDYVGDIEAAVIGAEKGTEWVKNCLDAYKDRSFLAEIQHLNMSTVPLLIGKVFEERFNIANNNRGTPHSNDEIAVFPFYYFSPKSIFSKSYDIKEETVCVHHFEGKWVEKTPLLTIKYLIHRSVILVFGQQGHNILIKMVRKWRTK